MSRDEIIGIFRKYVEEVMARPVEFTDSTRFKEDLDADSLAMVEVSMALEEALDIRLTEDELGSLRTVGQLLDLLERKLR
jgi:acyl carrier protein